MIYVVATLTIKPETRAEFIAAATACIKETRKEPGNIAYDLHESVTDPTKMVFVEQWENAEALVPHRGQEHMKAITQRPDVSESVSSELVQRGGKEVLVSLAQNRGARLDTPTMERLVEHSRAIGDRRRDAHAQGF